MLRHLLTALCALLFISCADAGDRLETEIQDLLRDRKMTVGVAVVMDGEPVAVVNNDAQYPLMSVFKFHQAVAVAHRMEELGLPLSHTLHIRKEEFEAATYSPLRDSFSQRDIDITVGDLLRYSVQYSDNHACDLLFRHIIGVEESDAYLRSLGIGEFALSANEQQMREEVTRCYDNRSAPLSAATLLDRFIRREIVAEPYFSFIADCMYSSTTGNSRLKRPFLGTDIRIGDKTGTGINPASGAFIAVNDIGFVTLPDGRIYSIALLIRDSRETLADTEEVIASISEKVYRAMSE